MKVLPTSFCPAGFLVVGHATCSYLPCMHENERNCVGWDLMCTNWALVCTSWGVVYTDCGIVCRFGFLT